MRLAGFSSILGAAALIIVLAACSAEPPLVVSDVPEQELFGQGEAMAENLCVSCHAIGASDESTHPTAPAFRDLSKRLDLRDLREPLTTGIMVGHPDMPEWAFEPQHVDAILFYLQSVQTTE